MSNGLDSIVEGKDAKILARNIKENRDKIDKTHEEIMDKLNDLPCGKNRSRLEKLEDKKSNKEAISEYREKEEDSWHKRWSIYIVVVSLVVGNVISLIQNMFL